MSRRRATSRIDALAEQVAEGFLEHDLTTAKWQALSEFYRRYLDKVLSDEEEVEELKWLCRKPVSKLRGSPQARALLAPYFGEDTSADPKRCCGCAAALETSPTGKRGPRRKHCDDACKQQAYRNRKREASERA